MDIWRFRRKERRARRSGFEERLIFPFLEVRTASSSFQRSETHFNPCLMPHAPCQGTAMMKSDLGNQYAIVGLLKDSSGKQAALCFTNLLSRLTGQQDRTASSPFRQREMLISRASQAERRARRSVKKINTYLPCLKGQLSALRLLQSCSTNVQEQSGSQ